MLQYDPCKYTYPSRRNVVYAKNGMACTSTPLGAQVGLEVLKARQRHGRRRGHGGGDAPL